MVKKILILILFCVSIHSQEGRVKILTFDGGGIRGVASLEFAKTIESYITRSLYDEFDVFAGTSTGAIIAAGLALGVTVDELSQHYQQWGREVFSHGHVTHLFRAKYNSDRLKEVLVHLFYKHDIPPDICLKDISKKVIIPVICLDDPVVGRWKLKVWENFSPEGGKMGLIPALLEATASPTMFPSHLGYLDAGVVVNDPSLVAFAYAYHPCSLADRGLALLSIGTGYFPKYIKGDENWGNLQWLDPWNLHHTTGPIPLFQMDMDVDNQIAEQLCAELLPKSFRRVTCPLSQDFGLDYAHAMPQIIKETREYITKNLPYFQSIGEWLQ